jgi:hypothetical protein
VATLDEWADTVAAELGIDAPSPDELRLVLDVAREVAHNVLRPGAPVSTFLLGVAVGRGLAFDPAATAIVDLARRAAPASDPQ